MAKNEWGDEIISQSKQTNEWGDEIVVPAKKKAPQAPKPVSKPARSRDTQYRLDALKAAGHHLAGFPLGLAQTGLNAAAWASPDIGLGPQIKEGSAAVDKYMQDREARYQSDVGDNPGSYLGAGVGIALPWLAGAPAKGMEYAGNLSRVVPAVKEAPGVLNSLLGLASRTGQRVVGGGAQGGLAALAMPNVGGGSKGEQVAGGVVTGGLLPVGVATGIGGAKAARFAWDNTLGNLTAARAEREAANILRQSAVRPESLNVANPSAVPGSRRSLAEETMDEGVAGLQNIFKNPAVDDIRRDSNNTARNQYLEEMTGAGSAYDDAVNFRTANNEGAFTSARQAKFSTPEPPEKSLIILPSGVKRPEKAIVADELSPLIKELEQVKAGFKGGNSEKVVQGYINRIKASKGDGLVLDNIRRDLDFAMSQKGGDVNIRDLAMVKEKFAGFLKQNPAFEKALTGWAKDSKPISRYDIGRAIVAPASRGAATDRIGYEVLKPQQFKGRMDNLDTVAQRATGFNRAKAGDYLTPQDFQRLRNVGDDLERQRFADTKGALSGSPTAQRQQAFKQLEATVLSRIPVVGKAFKWLDDIGQEKLKSELALVLDDPARAREVLANYPVKERLVLENAIRRMGWQGVLLGGNVR